MRVKAKKKFFFNCEREIGSVFIMPNDHPTESDFYEVLSLDDEEAQVEEKEQAGEPATFAEINAIEKKGKAKRGEMWHQALKG